MKKECPSQKNVNIYSNYTIRCLINIKELISADIKQHTVLRKLAKKGGTNEYTLKKGFKYLFQKTVYQHLVQARMNRANYLLAETNLNELDIAKQCGYKTLSGFVTAFRRYNGRRPGQVRKL